MLRSTARITARVLSLSLVAVAAPVLALMTAETASAHGNVSDPPARNFRCYQTWYGNHQDPSMPTVDPMCDYAWDNQPGAMYNGNGLFKENVAGNHQAALPDGTICGGNNSGYTTMNRVGPWIPTKKPTTFTLNLRDDSQHGADYLKIYISRQGYDPKTQPLKWSDLQLVKTTPRFAPANNYQTEVSVPGMTGHHVLFTIWQASHLDQSYYLCSDVDFGGGTSTPTEPTPTPTPTPTATATPTPTPTPTPTATATPTPTPTTSTPASAGCSDLPPRQPVGRRVPGRRHRQGRQLGDPQLDRHVDVAERSTLDEPLERVCDAERQPGDREEPQLERQPRGRWQHDVRRSGKLERQQRHSDAELQRGLSQPTE